MPGRCTICMYICICMSLALGNAGREREIYIHMCVCRNLQEWSLVFEPTLEKFRLLFCNILYVCVSMYGTISLSCILNMSFQGVWNWSEAGLTLQLRLQLWPGFTRSSPICFLFILCEDLLRIFLRKVASRLLARVEREGRSYMNISNNKKRLTYINACIHAYRQRYIHIWK